MKAEIKSTPILFSTPMVQAILAGRKTQTRRTLKTQPQSPATIMDSIHGEKLPTIWACWPGPNPVEPGGHHPDYGCKFPYGTVGDQLWVRETWAESCTADGTPTLVYKAGGNIPIGRNETKGPDFLIHDWTNSYDDPTPDKWRPSIFMPRWASRITLEITGVRLQRLQDITEADIIAEGCPDAILYGTGWYRDLWNAINGDGAWASNPWVWAITFKTIRTRFDRHRHRRIRVTLTPASGRVKNDVATPGCQVRIAMPGSNGPL